MSQFLQEQIGSIHKDNENYFKPHPLICNDLPQWNRIIKGSDEENYFPAKDFYENIIPIYLNDCVFIQSLIIPEAEINTITQVYSKEFIGQQVDFYLPQAYLVIEIDGFQHQKKLNQDLDIKRDAHLKKYGIKTIRFTTKEINTKNSEFNTKIKEIRKRITECHLQECTRFDANNVLIKLEDYKRAYIDGINLNDPNYIATAILRFQILILDLLLTGKLNINSNWDIELLTHDIKGFAYIAIEDLFIWMEKLFKLQKIKFERPSIKLKEINDISEFSSKNNLKINFSLLKRYTDENADYPSIIYLRTDYFDEYMLFDKDKKYFKAYDYFKVETSNKINYKLDENDKSTMLDIAWNIFMQANKFISKENFEFREGQYDIIANALNGNDTIGLLPTGSGKSICYQLSCILQPALSFVVCPIKSLMLDQVTDLYNCNITRIEAISSDNTAQEKQKIQQEYGIGKYFFVFISPERFQTVEFRRYLQTINNKFNIAYAVIDEAHCLSEWGHDFRTSYLNLVDTIRRYCKNYNFIALTATASSNVLKDLKIEFAIEKNDNIKTPVEYKRNELEFVIKNANIGKYHLLLDILNDLKNKEFYNENCGIVFTAKTKSSSKNQIEGCYNLSTMLTNDLGTEVPFYSGSNPDIKRYPSQEDFNCHKQNVQVDFKNNKFKLLTATKAFGMGVNKGNIAYTIHYGIPSSMESLYQEAGRAGREKKMFEQHKALCFVILNQESLPQQELNILWSKDSDYKVLKNQLQSLQGDLATQVFFLVSGINDIDKDVEIFDKLYNFLCENKHKKEIIIKSSEYVLNKDISKNENIEKYIYKLKQLGIIKDWTVDFKTRNYSVEIGSLENNDIKKNLESNINKYDPEFSFSNLTSGNRYIKLKEIYLQDISDFERYVRILLQWSFDTFLYSRRQSLKTVYETCIEVLEKGLTNQQFKDKIENYFRFSNKTHIFQQIANEPLKYELWFEIFYSFVDSVKTENIITLKEANDLIIALSRFLESYMQNTGLDFISGILRLMTDNYDNNDGRARFESSLNQISKLPHESLTNIIDNLYLVAKTFNLKHRNLLSESIIKILTPDKDFLIQLNNQLKDDYSLLKISENFATRMNYIKEKFEV